MSSWGWGPKVDYASYGHYLTGFSLVINLSLSQRGDKNLKEMMVGTGGPDVTPFHIQYPAKVWAVLRLERSAFKHLASAQMNLTVSIADLENPARLIEGPGTEL